MTDIYAIEPDSSPALYKFDRLQAAVGLPPKAADHFPTLQAQWVRNGNVKAIHRLALIGLGLLAIGIAIRAFGNTDGSLIAVVGCLVFAIARIRFRRLRHRAQR